MAYKKWSDMQVAYQIFLSIPEGMRPENLCTTEQIAAKLGVTTDTLALWELAPGFWDSVYERGRSVIGRSLADIMATLRDRAMQGSVQAAKVCLTLMGIQVDKLAIEHSMEQDQLMLILDPDAAAELERRREQEEG